MTQDTNEILNDQDTAGEVQDSSASFNADGTTQEQIEELLNLEPEKKYKLKDETLTGKELMDGYMRMKDYTQKTQRLSPVAKEQQYIENLDADLQAVIANPSLAAKFKEVYPQKYHFVVDRIMAQSGTPQGATQQSQTQGLDPRQIQKLVQEQVSPYMQKLQTLEQQAYEKEVNAQAQWLDSMHSKYASKYDLAEPEIVEKKLMDILEANKEGQKNDPFFEPTRIDQALFERVYKEVHARTEQRFQQRQKATVDRQLEVNAKGREMGRGQGQSPQATKPKPRNISDATDAFESFVRNQR